MSNTCSNLCNHKSFSFSTPLNPYTTTRFPLFPIQHSFLFIGRRSRGRSSSVPLKVAAQSSSSDLVLIATQEHHDGSVVFRFGDASEVVEKDDAVEDVESQTEQESSVVKVLDGDQDTQVIIKTGDSGYDSVEGRLVEVADGIRNADIGGDIAVSETNGIRDSSDNNAESSDTLSDVSEKEVLVSQPDANLSDFNDVVESTLDEVKFSVEPSISVELECTQVSKTEVVDYLDNVETEDASKSDTESASSELESMQVLQTEDRKSDTEDISPSAFPTTMAISDIELTDAANEDVEEDSKDMIVNEGTLIVEPPPSNPLDVQSMDAVNEDVEEDLKDMIVNEGTLIDELPLYNPLNVQLMDAVNEDAEEESQDMNINVATIIDEISSDQLIVEQPTLDEVSQLQAVDVKDQTTKDGDAEEELQDMNINEATIIDEMSSSDQLVVEQPTLDEVTQLQSVGVKDQTIEDELQQASTVNREENEVAYVMPVSRIEEEVTQPQSTPLDLQGILGQDRNNEIIQVDNETKYPSVSINLEAIQVSDNEVMDVTQPYAEDESRMVESKDTSEGDTQDLLPPATMHVSDVDDINQGLQDVNISEGAFTNEMPSSGPLGSEPPVEVLTTKDMDVKEVDMDERLQNMNVSEGNFIDEITSDPLGVEPTSEVSTAKYLDVKDVNTDERLQDTNTSEGTLINEMPTSDPIGAQPASEVSTTKDIDVKDIVIDERLQDTNASEGNFIDEMPTSDPLGVEPALEVSTANYTDVKDVDTDERLQDTNISEDTLIDEMPTSDLLGAEPTFEISVTEDMDVKDVDADERWQDMNTSEGTFGNDMPTSDPLGAERSLEVSTIKDMDVKDVDMNEMLKDNNIIEGTFIDEITTSDPLGAEPTLEVSTTEDVDVNDVDTEELLQDMNVGEGTFVDEMPTSDPVGAEPTLEVSTTVEAELQLVSNDNMDENLNAEAILEEPIVEEEASQPHLTPVELKATMKDSDIKLQDGTVDDEILQVIGEDADDSYIEDVEESSHKIESQPLQDEGVNHDMSEQCAETDAPESSILLKQGAHDPLLEAERTEGVVGSSELAEASEVTALLLAAEAEVEREEIYLTDDILLSGAALLEHPFKALTGGHDAYFVADGKWLGVANGVSQWSLEGTGLGVYAQELMRTCEEILLDTSNVPLTNPVELLCRGVKETNMSGSANVLIANFNGQALHVANIGDTGFLIIRHGAVYKKSSPLLHEFHFAVQVDDSDDPLQLVEEHLIELEVGDIVVSATDGLFDNLYEREITMIVSKSLQAGMKPQEIANILAKRAQEVGKSSFVRSPFSDAAQAAGYTGYAGGKPDNVAVIVSLVEKRSNLLAV
ncbi:hypothetical protein M8C21_004876 [Ambrosia artemisiifolia]|uniref:PPM-type phosphatase domain-containing protein n=1 Tax=Ambrosia artemisiifolia TaxID=4212 RepID=A0AAD5GCM7_AMBAR|nr:hypothetical protein M8C21_004876 [Ambrosia artemisiifolia]